jgi:hypothetical protein
MISFSRLQNGYCVNVCFPFPIEFTVFQERLGPWPEERDIKLNDWGFVIRLLGKYYFHFSFGDCTDKNRKKEELLSDKKKMEATHWSKL